MAYTKEQFLRELAIYTTGGAIGLKNTGRFLAYAGKKGINLAAMGAGRAAVPAARGIGAIVRRNPYAFAGLTLYEAERRGLLDEPIARGQEAFKEGAAEFIERSYPYMPQEGPPPGFEGFGTPVVTKKRKPSAYNKAVKAGMARIKGPKSNGKRGSISKPKAAFKTVNQVASRMFAKKKVPRTGIKGKVARAIRKSMPKSTWTVKTRKY